MPEQLLIIRNITHEGPGLLEGLLHKHGIATHIEDLSQRGTFPDPRQYRAVVVLGGPQSANDETPVMQLELRQIKRVLDEEIPYLGICLGMQMLIKAAGGTVIPCPEREIGFTESSGNPYQIELTAAGRADALFAELGSTLPVFQLHGETVQLPPSGTQLLASGSLCHNQVVKAGANAYGLQCHFELTRSMFSELLNIDSDLKRMNHTELLGQFDELNEEYNFVGRKLMENFLKIAGLL